MRQAWKRTWKNLARERIENTMPTIPLGKKLWPLSSGEKCAVKQLFADEVVARLATLLRSRDEGASVEVLDAAYWVKGCSLLGRLRVAVLLDVGRDSSSGNDLCLMDIKEAIRAAAPRYPAVKMPRDNGERMRASRFLDRSVFLRELLPQDLKVEINRRTRDEAMKVARFLALVVGRAHARQMDASTRASWRVELQRNR